MKVSIGTEGVLGLRKVKADAQPTTAYLMLGTSCLNNCLFCPQARNSREGENLLSRVIWNNYRGNIWSYIQKSFSKKKIVRACIQTVNQPGIFNLIEHEIKKAKENTNIPICISGGVNSISDVEKLLGLGAERVSIALDAVTPEIYRKVKGLDFLKRLHLIKTCARKFPGRIGTHLIVGLGETEEEMISMIQDMYDWKVNTALFAFTPVKGTVMEFDEPPPISWYRRIQIGHYLIKNMLCRKEEIVFANQTIKQYPKPIKELKNILADGSAFLTSGCRGCNRPYYNERPGSTIYNYPRAMTQEEIEKAFNEAGIK